MSDEVQVVRRLFAAVEDRNLENLLACYSDDVEIHEAEELPYGGTWRGRAGAAAHAAAFLNSWGALQDRETCSLEPHFWGDGAGTVCALFRHRAVDVAGGTIFDAAEVGVYKVRQGLVVHSQMFHADSGAVVRFLRRVGRGEPESGALP